MTDTHTLPTNPNLSAKKTDWASILQFSGSTLVLIFTLPTIPAMLSIGVVQLFNPNYGPSGATESFMFAATMFYLSVLVAPSALTSFLAIYGREFKLNPKWLKALSMLHPKRTLFLLPLLLGLGYASTKVESITWLTLPLIHLATTSLVALGLLWLGIRWLERGSPQRVWGIFASGLILGPAITVVVEIGALILGVSIFVITVLPNKPDLLDQLLDLVFQMQYLSIDSPEFLEQINEIISTPTFLVAFLIFASLIVPVIEEAIKPVGVWLLVGKKMTAAQGFTAGLISGAGFAIFENLFNIEASSQWVLISAARIGATSMHIFTSGLMGWAIALAVKERRVLRLAVTYILSILLHGFWNAIVILLSFADRIELGVFSRLNIELIGTASLSTFTLIIWLMLIRINHNFKKPKMVEYAVQSENSS